MPFLPMYSNPSHVTLLHIIAPMPLIPCHYSYATPLRRRHAIMFVSEKAELAIGKQQFEQVGRDALPCVLARACMRVHLRVCACTCAKARAFVC